MAADFVPIQASQMTWRAISIQSVIFPSPSAPNVTPLEVWKQLLLGDPTSFYSHPPGMPRGGNASGPAGDFLISVGTLPGRIDLTLALPEQTQITLIEDIKSALEALAGYSRALIRQHSPVRIAIAMQLARLTDSPEAAVRIISDATGIDGIPETALDLAFNINMRKPVAHTEEELNRVCRWSVGIMQTHHFDAANASAQPQGPVLVQQANFASFRIDVNSVQRDKPPTVEQSLSLYNHIESEANELMSGGYAYLRA